MDTLAVRLAVPLIGPAKVFHLLGLRPAGRTKKKPRFSFEVGAFSLIRQRPTLPYGDRIVPSALEGLTAEFGMGSGVTPPLSPPETYKR